MRQCTEAASRPVFLMVLAFSAGCADLPQLPQRAGDPGVNPRFQTDSSPFTDLRIPKKQTRVTAAPQDPDRLVQASATAPAPPSLEPHGSDPGAPPLKSGEPNANPAGNSVDKLRAIYRDAAQAYASMDSYIVRFRRREQVNGRDKPEETLLLKFRKQPFSVSLRWLGTEGSGREVVYVKGLHEDKIQTLLAAGDMPLMPAGKRLAIAPDSVFVRSASRHSIYETGFGSSIARLGAELEAFDKAGERLGSLRYLGSVQRPEFKAPLEGVEVVIPAGTDPLLPRGGRRMRFYDATTKLPTLIITYDDTGHEVEYYCFDRLQYPVKLDDDDFDPDKLWPVKKPAAQSEGGSKNSPAAPTVKTGNSVSP
jgi:hypothetical protein